MPKSSSAFTGMKLTEDVHQIDPSVDQRLFSLAPPPAASKPDEARTEERGKEGSRETGREASHATKRETASVLDINIRPYRKDSFLLTDEEFEALDDLKRELRRLHGLNVTKNDIARCALHNLIEDYQQQRAQSAAVRRLMEKRG